MTFRDSVQSIAARDEMNKHPTLLYRLHVVDHYGRPYVWQPTVVVFALLDGWAAGCGSSPGGMTFAHARWFSVAAFLELLLWWFAWAIYVRRKDRK